MRPSSLISTCARGIAFKSDMVNVSGVLTSPVTTSVSVFVSFCARSIAPALTVAAMPHAMKRRRFMADLSKASSYGASIHAHDDVVGFDHRVGFAADLQVELFCRLRGDHRDQLEFGRNFDGDLSADRSHRD